MEDFGQVRVCCNCVWNDKCCTGCNEPQEDCDDWTPLYDSGFLVDEYKESLKERADDYYELLVEYGVFDEGEWDEN